MLRKLGLAISYFIAIVYILLILWPLLYCYQHQWCKGAGELDAFMPAFMLTPLGAIARGSHCTMPYNTSGKDGHGPGFYGLLRLFSRLFCSV